MNRKKIIGLLFVMLFVISFGTACKKSVGTPEDNAVVEDDTKEEDDTDTDQGNDTEETEDADQADGDTVSTISGEYTFGFSGINMENPFFSVLEQATREAIEAKDYTMVTRDPASDVETQISQLKDMADSGVKVVFLCPVDWEKITPALEYLKEKDVAIVNVDTQVKEMDYVDAFVGSNNKEAGKICGEDLISRKPDGGTVAILEVSAQNSINERITGFEETLSSAAVGFEVVAREDTNGTFDEGLDAAQKILEKYPDVTAIMCGSDQLAVAAKTALNLAGNSENTIVYGVDGSPDIKKELKKADNQIVGTAAQSPINMGKDAAKIGISILKGDDYDKETYEDVFMINRKNVDMYGTDGWQ